MSEIVKQLITGLYIFLGSAIGTAICGAILTGIIKGAIAKHSAKNDLKKIYKEAVDTGIEQVKSISYEQTIQPVVESGLERVNEKSQEFIVKSYEDVKKSYTKVLEILESIAVYFDKSIVIPAEKKEKVHQLIAEAKEVPVEPQKIKVEETPVVEQKSEKPAIDVER